MYTQVLCRRVVSDVNYLCCAAVPCHHIDVIQHQRHLRRMRGDLVKHELHDVSVAGASLVRLALLLLVVDFPVS